MNKKECRQAIITKVNETKPKYALEDMYTIIDLFQRVSNTKEFPLLTDEQWVQFSIIRCIMKCKNLRILKNIRSLMAGMGVSYEDGRGAE